MNLGDIDLNLLKTLRVLLAERNVTRTGEVIGRSQPAVSNALQRLRDVLGDDLLVRGPNGLILTPRAEALRQPLCDAMALVEGLVFEDAAFDPSAATGVFRISMPDRLSLAVVPSLLDRLQREAPHMSLHVMTVDRGDALDRLSEDLTDIAIGFFDRPPPHLGAELLLREDFCCVLRKNHPLLKARARFDMAAVLSYPHVVVSAAGGRVAIFDSLLAERELTRSTLVRVNNFTAVPHLLGRSDMIGIFTQLAADVLATSAGLAKRPVPVDVGRVATHMAWHVRNNRDKKHVWLRQQVKAVYRQFRSAQAGRAASGRSKAPAGSAEG